MSTSQLIVIRDRLAKLISNYVISGVAEHPVKLAIQDLNNLIDASEQEPVAVAVPDAEFKEVMQRFSNDQAHLRATLEEIAKTVSALEHLSGYNRVRAETNYRAQEPAKPAEPAAQAAA